MARLARIVIPGVAHHATQRGNRGLPVFFGDDDRRLYLALLAAAAGESGTRCLAWCLMDNHVHLILVPEREDGLRAMLGEAHCRYTRHVNFREALRRAQEARASVPGPLRRLGAKCAYWRRVAVRLTAPPHILLGFQ